MKISNHLGKLNQSGIEFGGLFIKSVGRTNQFTSEMAREISLPLSPPRMRARPSSGVMRGACGGGGGTGTPFAVYGAPTSSLLPPSADPFFIPSRFWVFGISCIHLKDSLTDWVRPPRRVLILWQERTHEKIDWRILNRSYF